MHERRTRVGMLLVIAGLLIQLGVAFYWSPATFLISAGVGLPVVVVGALLLGMGVRRAARQEAQGETGSGSGRPDVASP